MSTIATDGKCMAADTQITGGGYLCGDTEKVFETVDGVFAAVGYTDMSAMFRNWVATQGMSAHTKPDLGKEFEALWLKPDGTVWYAGFTLVWVQYTVPMALGTGGELAIGAMLFGASPRQAVEIAMMRDTRTGGDIHVLYV